MRLCSIAACAGSAIAFASADELSLSDLSATSYKTLNDSVPRRRHQASADYSCGDRAYNVIVYNNSSSVLLHQTVAIGLCSLVLDEKPFNPIPYRSASSSRRTIIGIEYVLNVSGSSASFDLRFSFFRQSDVVFTDFSGPGTSMIDPNAVPYYSVTIQGNKSCPGFLTLSGYRLLLTPDSAPAGDIDARNNGMTDDSDFSAFATAYDALVCS